LNSTSLLGELTIQEVYLYAKGQMGVLVTDRRFYVTGILKT